MVRVVRKRAYRGDATTTKTTIAAAAGRGRRSVGAQPGQQQVQAADQPACSGGVLEAVFEAAFARTIRIIGGARGQQQLAATCRRAGTGAIQYSSSSSSSSPCCSTSCATFP